MKVWETNKELEYPIHIKHNESNFNGMDLKQVIKKLTSINDVLYQKIKKVISLFKYRLYQPKYK